MPKQSKRPAPSGGEILNLAIEGTLALWFNKQTLRRLEIPVRHRMRALQGGWRAHFTEPGKLVIHGADDQVGVDVEADDYVVANGDDLYVILHRDKRERRAAAEEARRKRHAEAAKHHAKSAARSGRKED